MRTRRSNIIVHSAGIKLQVGTTYILITPIGISSNGVLLESNGMSMTKPASLRSNMSAVSRLMAEIAMAPGPARYEGGRFDWLLCSARRAPSRVHTLYPPTRVARRASAALRPRQAGQMGIATAARQHGSACT